MAKPGEVTGTSSAAQSLIAMAFTRDLEIAPEVPRQGVVVPDVTIEVEVDGKATCSMSSQQRGKLVAKLTARLTPGLQRGFRSFPLDHDRFRRNLLNELLTEEQVCAAVMPKEEVVPAERDTMREHAKKSSLDIEESKGRGVVLGRPAVVLSEKCPVDPTSSDAYIGIKSCDELKNLAHGRRAVAAIYASSIETLRGGELLRRYDLMKNYKPYADSGPTRCGDSSSYHHFSGFADLKFPTHDMHGPGWAAWELDKSCRGPNGEEGTSLKFTFGTRIALPITVAHRASGETSYVSQTLFISTSIAETNDARLEAGGALANIGSFVTFGAVSDREEMAAGYFIGAELAKKLFLDGHQYK